MKKQILHFLQKSIGLSFLLTMVCLSVQANTVIISVSSNVFSPAAANVAVGDTVKWVFVNGNHTTTSVNIPAGASAWDSPINAGSTTFLYKVTAPGNYTYKCTPHANMGMLGGFIAVSPTGINEFQDRKKLSFYPNPCVDFINVEFMSSKNKNTQILISDILGNQVYKYEAETGVNQWQKKRIDLPVIPAGVYFLSILDENNRQTFKILKKNE